MSHTFLLVSLDSGKNLKRMITFFRQRLRNEVKILIIGRTLRVSFTSARTRAMFWMQTKNWLPWFKPNILSQLKKTFAPK